MALRGIAGSFGGVTQPVFELGEQLFDRVAVGRAFRQERRRGTGGVAQFGAEENLDWPAHPRPLGDSYR